MERSKGYKGLLLRYKRVLNVNLFDTDGVILIAVDDKFTLDYKGVYEVNRRSIHRQFLDRYYSKDSPHKTELRNVVENRGNSTEVVFEADGKIFILFAYSKQGERKEYSSQLEYERGFKVIKGSIERVFRYCKLHFPNEIVYTAAVGSDIRNDYTKSLVMSVGGSKEELYQLAKKVGITIKVISED